MTEATTKNKVKKSKVARLIQMGRDKAYVTSDDILHLYPEPEEHIDSLDRAFAALFSAGIPFIDDHEDG